MRMLLLHSMESGTHMRIASCLNELIYTLLCFSSANSHVCLSMMLVLAPESILIGQLTSFNDDFKFLLIFISYSKRIIWVIFIISSIYHICGASLGAPVALGFSFSSFTFLFRLVTLFEKSFQSTFATRLNSC